VHSLPARIYILLIVLGGLRHAAAAISGQSVFLRMKFEGGVHRVQRVPKTEKSGRMHTSTVTVAILPQPSEVLSHNLICCPILSSY